MFSYFSLLFVFFGISCHSFFRSPRKPWSYKKIYMKKEFNEEECREKYFHFLNKNDYVDKTLLLSSFSSSKIVDALINSKQEGYQTFKENYKKIISFNNENRSFVLDINEFADNYKDHEEDNNLMKKPITIYDILKNDFIGIKQILEKPQYYLDKYKNLSQELVWNESVLPEIKNQGQWGSCWSFSTTGALESYNNIRNFSRIPLSEQELVDCSKENHGCSGGLMHLALDYVIENKGLLSQEDYPYNASDGSCLLHYSNTSELITKEKVIGSNISDYNFVVPRSVIDIKASLKKGPICIALDASPFEFRFYKSGIIDIPSPNTSQINHAVLLTGYSKNENGSYWIIQNSWGNTWGDNGYAKIKIENGDGVLLCQLYGVYIYE